MMTKIEQFEKKLQNLKLEKINDTKEINFLRQQNNNLIIKYRELSKKNGENIDKKYDEKIEEIDNDDTTGDFGDKFFIVVDEVKEE